MKKIIAIILATAMAAGVTCVSIPAKDMQAAKKVSLSRTKCTMGVGETVTVKIKNLKTVNKRGSEKKSGTAKSTAKRNKAQWSVIAVKNKDVISLKNKKQDSVKIVAKNTGIAKIVVKVTDKKLVCRVTVRDQAAISGIGDLSGSVSSDNSVQDSVITAAPLSAEQTVTPLPTEQTVTPQTTEQANIPQKDIEHSSALTATPQPTEQTNIPPKDEDDNGGVTGPMPPLRDVYNYSAESTEAFFQWWNGEESKTVHDGAFKNIVELYNDIGYILCPSVEGEEVRSVFVDSYVDYINFVFSEMGIRIGIEPLSTEKNKDFDSADIKQFMIEKFNMQLNQKEIIKEQPGYEAHTQIYTEENLYIDGEATQCILKTCEYQNRETEHVLTFIKDEMLVTIIYYDTEDNRFNLKSLEKVSFDRK